MILLEIEPDESIRPTWPAMKYICSYYLPLRAPAAPHATFSRYSGADRILQDTEPRSRADFEAYVMDGVAMVSVGEKKGSRLTLSLASLAKSRGASGFEVGLLQRKLLPTIPLPFHSIISVHPPVPLFRTNRIRLTMARSRLRVLKAILCRVPVASLLATCSVPPFLIVNLPHHNLYLVRCPCYPLPSFL